MALPALALAHGFKLGRRARTPSAKHRRARNRIFAEQPRGSHAQLKQTQFAILRPLRAARYILRDRAEVGRGAVHAGPQAFENHQFELIGVEHPTARIGGFHDPAQIAAQERKLDVGGDPGGLSQPQLQKFLDDSIRYDDHRARQRIAALLHADSLRQRRNQFLETVGIMETNHPISAG